MRTALLVLLAACGSDSKIDRVRQDPTAAILSPEEGAVFREGAGDVLLVGEVGDSHDAPAALTATWTVDGAATSATPDADGRVELTLAGLAQGDHAAILHVVDGDGDEAEVAVAFEVAGPLGAPVVAITEPADGTTADVGAVLAFRGEATDTTTPAHELAFTWSSDLQGELPDAISGNGESALLIDSLVAGTHTVTLAATDGDGEVGTDSVVVTIEEAVVVAEPGDLVFSELMIDPEVVDDEIGEWVELYNTGSAPIDIGGYTFRDDDVDAWELEGPLLVAGGDYVVLCASLDVAVNGGVPCDGWFAREASGGGLALANGPDEVVLARPDGVEIDGLHYDEAWIDKGVALGVDPAFREGGANDDRTHWCAQTTVVSAGGEPGTPGLDNDACSP